MSTSHKVRTFETHYGWRWECSCGRASLFSRAYNRAAVRRAGQRHAHRANRREGQP